MGSERPSSGDGAPAPERKKCAGSGDEKNVGVQSGDTIQRLCRRYGSGFDSSDGDDRGGFLLLAPPASPREGSEEPPAAVVVECPHSSSSSSSSSASREDLFSFARGKLAALRDRIRERGAGLEAAAADAERARTRLDDLDNGREGAREGGARWMDDLTTARAEIRRLKAGVDGDGDARRASEEAAAAASSASERWMRALEGRVKDAGERLSTLERKRANMKAALRALREREKRDGEAKEALEAKVKELEGRLGRREAKLEKSQKRIEELEGTIEAQAEEMRRQAFGAKQAEAEDARTRNMEHELKACHERNVEMEAELNRARNCAADLKGANEGLQDAVKELGGLLERRSSEWRKEEERHKFIVRGLREHIELMTQQLTEQKEVYGLERVKSQKCIMELEDRDMVRSKSMLELAAKSENLQKNQVDKERETESVRKENKRLKSELWKMRDERKSIERESDLVRRENERLKTELVDAQMHLVDLGLGGRAEELAQGGHERTSKAPQGAERVGRLENQIRLLNQQLEAHAQEKRALQSQVLRSEESQSSVHKTESSFFDAKEDKEDSTGGCHNVARQRRSSGIFRAKSLMTGLVIGEDAGGCEPSRPPRAPSLSSRPEQRPRESDSFWWQPEYEGEEEESCGLAI